MRVNDRNVTESIANMAYQLKNTILFRLYGKGAQYTHKTNTLHKKRNLQLSVSLCKQNGDSDKTLAIIERR